LEDNIEPKKVKDLLLSNKEIEKVNHSFDAKIKHFENATKFK
jgi:hypothetical protein